MQLFRQSFRVKKNVRTETVLYFNNVIIIRHVESAATERQIYGKVYTDFFLYLQYKQYTAVICDEIYIAI